MIEDRELQALVDFSGSGHVLSVYLDTDLGVKSKDAVKLMFRERVKTLPAEAKAEIDAVRRYLSFEFDWQTRGLAVFASGDELWKVLPLPIPVGAQAYYMERPYIRTLTDVLDQFGKYAVALVDRESVRLFSVALGKIQSETESFGEELKRHKQGGWAAARYQRHEDNLALHNLKQTVDVIQAFCESTQCKQLILGGSAEAIRQIRDLLPKQLSFRLLGDFAADIEATPNEILSHSLDIAVQVDLAKEKEQVTEAITAAAKGGAGSTGLPDTLALLHEGRVRMLLVAEDYRAPGFVCPSCGYVATDSREVCPLCSHEGMVESVDVVNLAIHKAVETGAGVNIVRDNDQLEVAGGIAALLRY